MSNKKLNFTALALISLFGLTACNNEVIAKPTGYDDAVVMKVEGYKEEIYNNLMSVIYDEIRDGSLGSDVLNKVLYQYSLTIFGAYDHTVAGIAADDITLKDAADDVKLNGDNAAQANAFILAHKAYWTYNNEGKRVNDDTAEIVEVADDATPCKSERARVLAKWNNVEDRIAKKMYKNISGGSYSDRNHFFEERYLMSLRSSLKKVADPANATVAANLHNDVLLDPDTEDVDVFDATKGFLTRENYQSETNTYIVEEVVPGIYSEMLVEQYILDEQYATLGRTYARKVNVVSIKNNEEYPLAARYLVNEFVDKYISGDAAAPDAATIADSDNLVGLDELKILSNAWKGVDLTAAEQTLLDDSDGFTTKVISGETVYLGTEYGDMMEDYEKILAEPAKNDSSIESDFTNSNTYTKEVGKEIKSREINLRDHTENGWFIRNGGLSDLPSSIRDRLFNISVALALNEKGLDDASNVEQDRWQYEGGAWKYRTGDELDGENNYVALIKGSYYLKSAESGSDYRDMVHYDSSTSTYYIIQIEEAASTSKLSKTNENRYAVSRGNDVMEEFVNEICEKVASSDTYKNLSTQHWLKEAVLKYHDDVVYDYFKANYPELFE